MTGATGARAPSSASCLGREDSSDEREASLFDGWDERLEKARAQREKVLAERAAAKGAASSGLHSDPARDTSENWTPNDAIGTWPTRLEQARQQRQKVLVDRSKQSATTSGVLPHGSESGLSLELPNQMAGLIHEFRSPEPEVQPVSAARAPVSETPPRVPPDEDRPFRGKERFGKDRLGFDDTQTDMGKLDPPARGDLLAGIEFQVPPRPTFRTETAPGHEAPSVRFRHLSRQVTGAAALALIAGLVAVAAVFLPGWRESEPETAAIAEPLPLTPSVDVESSADMRDAGPERPELQTARKLEGPSGAVVAARAADTQPVPSLARNAGGGTVAEAAAPVGGRPIATSKAEPTELLARADGISTGAVDLLPRVAALRAEVPVVGREPNGNDLTALSIGPDTDPSQMASISETMAALDPFIAPSRGATERSATTAAKAVSAFVGSDRARSVMPTVSSALANVPARAASIASAATGTARSLAALSPRDAAAVPDRPMNLHPAGVGALPGRLREADTVSMPAVVAVPTGVIPPTAHQAPRAGSVQTALVGTPGLPSISSRVAAFQAAPSVRGAVVEPNPFGPGAVPPAQPRTVLASASEPGALSDVREAIPLTGVEVRRTQVRVFAPGSVPEPDVNAITADLVASGYDLESSARVGFSISQSNVRYYHAQDAALAATLAEDTGAELRDFTAVDSGTAPRTVELWLAGSGSSHPSAKARPARTTQAKRQPAPSVSNRTVQLRNRVIQKLRSARSQ